MTNHQGFGLDRLALGAADVAFLDEPHGTSDMVRVEAAIAAYLWALENTTETPLGTAGPSLDQWRAHRRALLP